MHISSLQNPKIKNAVKLKEAKERKSQNTILIEGKRELRLAAEAGISLIDIFVQEDIPSADIPFLHKYADKIITVSPEVFEKISFRQNPDGILAVAEPKSANLIDLKISDDPLILILESIEKPGNLGAIIRSADGAQADAVIIADPRIDIYNPNAIRASQGTIFCLPVLVDSSENIVKWLKDRNIKIIATTPSAAQEYSDIDLKGPAAIIAGTEDQGLSRYWLERADEKVKISMRGRIDSLNVSVSTAIILFEAIRQRKDK